MKRSGVICPRSHNEERKSRYEPRQPELTLCHLLTRCSNAPGPQTQFISPTRVKTYVLGISSWAASAERLGNIKKIHCLIKLTEQQTIGLLLAFY